MNFEFATATRVIFGVGTLRKAGTLAAEMGKRALVVTGIGPERAQPLLEQLAGSGVGSDLYTVSSEPTIDVVYLGVQSAQQRHCDLVIGFGGGSALDTGKAIAVLLNNPGDIYDYLEVVGRGRPLTRPPAPYMAIPTTAGTGAEVTRNAVLGAPEQGVKVSLRSALMLPRLALVDPELTYSLPPAVTASTGLDALTQLIEPFVSNQANPLTDALCIEGMKRAARSLQRAFERGDDAPAREDMCLASLLGGMALANSKLGAVHGFAAPLGGMFPAPHGAICARLLPFVMATNVRALHERAPDNQALLRYVEVARILTNKPGANALDGAAWVHNLCNMFDVPPLAVYGLRQEGFPDLIEKSAKASSMQGNPIKLSAEEMGEILSQAL